MGFSPSLLFVRRNAAVDGGGGAVGIPSGVVLIEDVEKETMIC